MTRKFGNCLMMMGTVLILGALSLFLYNQYEQTSAERASANIMTQMQALIGESATEENTANTPVSEPTAETLPVSGEMKEVEIDGYAYIGYLSIPALDLELPIMSQWNYKQLKIAPCRFTGTVPDDNLVIAAHNYTRHFGLLSRLTEGDNVIFTDMEGMSTVYKVVALDILAPTAIEEVTASDFDLTLFTCTYGGENRVTVFCNRTDHR